MKTLEKIIEKYSSTEYSDNYSIGGGLDDSKFASRRHQDAKNDDGKLTLGKANQMFSKATGLTVDEIKEVIKYAVPCMEWHHAGLLPKSYGGGMKKTYFLNASEIVNIATNWVAFVEKLAISKNAARLDNEQKKNREQLQQEFLKANAKRVERVSSTPKFFYETNKEMDGKYGWFSSYGKSYNLPEYYSGWAFESKEKYEEFFKL
jgi:hypothetical protein